MNVLNEFQTLENAMAAATTLPRPAAADLSSDHSGRLQRIRAEQITYIPNDDFAGSAATNEASPERLTELLDAPTRSDTRLGESNLLTRDQEQDLFQRMNFVKYLADCKRNELLEHEATIVPEMLQEQLAAIETLLDEGRQIRDHIVQANMRLVMSIVKKFVTPQLSFDELLSEGIMTLMQAVDKFDYDRGFRFSTYAYRSIARAAYHAVAATQKEEARMTRDAEEWAFEQPNVKNAASMVDQVWSNIREVTNGMLEQLDRRERFIIRSRYALGSHRKVRTFQYLADKLGVSKERARQLERRAVQKMQSMSEEYDIDELFGAALA